MRICTYSNPFKIEENKPLWELITHYPHFCASDTLVQGLETKYKRESFGYLRTIDTLINTFYKNWTQNPQNDMNIFLTVSQILREMPEGTVKKTFRFNIADVVKSVNFLLMLNAESDSFQVNNLTMEQQELFKIYDKVKASGTCNEYEKLKLLSRDEYIDAVKLTCVDEINYWASINKKDVEKIDITFPINTLYDAQKNIDKVITYLRAESQKPPQFGKNNIKTYQNDLKRIEILGKLIDSEDTEVFNKVIIHGVHKITAIMYFLFEHLEKMEIEVVFLINYCKNLPEIYRTWRDVYSWCNVEFEYEDDLDMSEGNQNSNLGQALAEVIEGKQLSVEVAEPLVKYKNLTSFTDQDVSKTFAKDGNSLSKMDTQYYAVRGESSNEILRVYFPGQFGDKHFLSYPIGQFILGIYSMWDFEEKVMKVNERSLAECIAGGLYTKIPAGKIFNIFEKIKLYFSDIENVTDYFARLNTLRKGIEIINKDMQYTNMKMLSFFSISTDELDEFKLYIEFLNEITSSLFADATGKTIDYAKHFRSLMDIISNRATGDGVLSQTETDLLAELSERLTQYQEGAVIGNIDDVREAIAFYLAGKKSSDTSNWIVRNFEQIDGAVLLSERSKAKYYHFALMSNAHMTKQITDALTWPLSDDMFKGYSDLESAVPVVTRGLLERRNFLKYSLFYGAFFTKCAIKLSYIEEENGEEQTPYYLLKVLNLKEKLFEEVGLTSFISVDSNNTISDFFDHRQVDVNLTEIFSICPYKFLMCGILKSSIIYENDFHIKYFISNFMYFNYFNEYKRYTRDIEIIVKEKYKGIKEMFPFWGEAVFSDLIRNTMKQINNDDTTMNSDYIRKKNNFLIAQWKDENEVRTMNFRKKDLSLALTDYMNSKELYPLLNDLPHAKVCQNCCFTDVCLRNYYEVHEVHEVLTDA